MGRRAAHLPKENVCRFGSRCGNGPLIRWGREAEEVGSRSINELGIMMKIQAILLTTLLLIGCADRTDSSSTEHTNPTFEQFKSSVFCIVTSAQTRPNFTSTSFSIEERQKIREQYLQPDNYFNCKYSIASFQGENQKWSHVIVDTQTGKISEQIVGTNGILYSKKSSLIIVNPSDAQGTPSDSTEYWTMDNDELKRVE
jgi:hypothetical protein